MKTEQTEHNNEERRNSLTILKIAKNSFHVADAIISGIIIFVKRTCLVMSVLLFMLFVYQATSALFFETTFSDGRIFVLVLSGLGSMFLLFFPYRSDFIATWQTKKTTILGKEIEYQQEDKNIFQVPYTREFAWVKFEYQMYILVFVCIPILTMLLFAKY